MTAWAKRLGHEPNRQAGETYWTEGRIRTALKELLDGRSSWPRRREFQDADLAGLWKRLANRSELSRWAKEFGFEPPRRGRPSKRTS